MHHRRHIEILIVAASLAVAAGDALQAQQADTTRPPPRAAAAANPRLLPDLTSSGPDLRSPEVEQESGKRLEWEIEVALQAAVDPTSKRRLFRLQRR
jgi:hypothetical protein